MRSTRPFSGLLAVIALSLLGPTPTSAAPASPSRPNILVIIADDLGFADVGVHGGQDIPTPNIDSIAKDGIRFTSGYVSGPYCSPTRAGLLTGRYQQRFGHEFNPPGPNATNRIGSGLSLEEVTIADRLQTAGYVTGLVGKWHLGAGEPFHPLNRGFSEFFGFLGAAHSYTNLDATSPNAIHRGLQPVEEKEYLTDAFTREAVAFIGRHRQEPFYLQLAYNAVHSPLDAHPNYYDQFSHLSDEKRRRFAALYAAFDDGVGRVLAKLRETGLEENTVVFFFSDNGGPTQDNTSRNDPLRGYKAQTWEGGIHVPFFVRWPGRLPAGRTYDYPVIQLDIHATALALAGIEVKPEWKLDGVNLLPFLAGEKRGAPHEALYWRFGDQLAIRSGDWKLVKAQEGESSMRLIQPGPASINGAQLFNLARDPSETVNLAQKNPRKFRALVRQWTRWNAELPEPAWKPRSGPRETPDGRPRSTAATLAPGSSPAP